jgi:cation diffusion facilitator CzcD-associated flavoprotein CzcO
MDFWAGHMPRGMLLRSPWEGSHIADPLRAFTLERYEAPLGVTLPRQLPLEEFVRYGQWFQRQSVPDLDPRCVTQVERADDGFHLTLEDGERQDVRAVVVATGIGPFAHRPAAFASLPTERVSHASDPVNRDLGRFAGRRVAVVGGGQSALESASLLSEAGAEVEVLIRQPRVTWLNTHPVLERLMDSRFYPFRAPAKIGPLGLNWLIEHPRLYTLFPRRLRARMTTRALRPAGSGWLRPRTQKVTFHTNCRVASAAVQGDKVRLLCEDGTEREADHVLLGTGYRIDILRYDFLSPEVLQGVRTANGYPVLNAGFEASVPGLYFVGATAAYSFGPLCRFVAGTQFTAGALTRSVRKQPAARQVATAEV